MTPTLFVTGGVDSVDHQSGTVTLWLLGFDGLHTTSAAGLPDWMLRPDAKFQAQLDEESYRRQELSRAVWSEIEQQELGDLNEDEVLGVLDGLLGVGER